MEEFEKYLKYRKEWLEKQCKEHRESIRQILECTIGCGMGAAQNSYDMLKYTENCLFELERTIEEYELCKESKA